MSVRSEPRHKPAPAVTLPSPRSVRAVDGLTSVTGILAFFACWELVVRGLGIPQSFLPAPSAIVAHIADHLALFWRASQYSLSLAVKGYLLATLVGVATGSLFVRSEQLETALFPFFVASQAVPIIAFSAVLVLWFGNGPASKVIVSFYLTFFPVVVNTVKGLRSSDAEAVRLMQSFGASWWTILWKLRFWSALPSIFVALRIGTSTSLIGAIVGEWFGDIHGLGAILLYAMYSEDTVRLWAGVLSAATVGLAFYAVPTTIERSMWWHRVTRPRR